MSKDTLLPDLPSTFSALLSKPVALFQSLVCSISQNAISMLTPTRCQIPPPPPTPLSALSNIISSGLSKIESTYSSQGVEFPSLDSPDLTPIPAALDTPEMTETIHHVIAAAAQIIATLRDPRLKVFEDVYSVRASNCRLLPHRNLLSKTDVHHDRTAIYYEHIRYCVHG